MKWRRSRESETGMSGGRKSETGIEGHFGKLGIFAELCHRDRGLLPRLIKVDGGSTTLYCIVPPGLDKRSTSSKKLKN
jgi:hypothetical protein